MSYQISTVEYLNFIRDTQESIWTNSNKWKNFLLFHSNKLYGYLVNGDRESLGTNDEYWIFRQDPNATMVRTKEQWSDIYNRNVSCYAVPILTPYSRSTSGGCEHTLVEAFDISQTDHDKSKDDVVKIVKNQPIPNDSLTSSLRANRRGLINDIRQSYLDIASQDYISDDTPRDNDLEVLATNINSCIYLTLIRLGIDTSDVHFKHIENGAYSHFINKDHPRSAIDAYIRTLDSSHRVSNFIIDSIIKETSHINNDLDNLNSYFKQRFNTKTKNNITSVKHPIPTYHWSEPRLYEYHFNNHKDFEIPF